MRGYCDFNGSLQYRLDKESALVTVSAMAAGSPRPVLTIEHVQKVTSEERVSLLKSLAVEWTSVAKTASSAEGGSQASPADVKFWDEPVRKMRRILSEAHSL